MISRKKSLREVYVWELPVRIFHWVNATAIVALCVTGYIIGNPPAIQHATPPEANYWFGWVRFIHFAAAFVFILNFIVRLYWAFAGNSFARWNNYLPLTRKQWRSIFDTTKVDVLLLSPKPVYDIGHNSLAAFTYFGVFVLFIIQTVTGLAMKELPGNQIDLLFLDIQMPELNGLEFSKMVAPRTRIVFTTAFGQYAIDGYRVNALDYLLKPISYVDFLQAANKALQWFELVQKPEEVDSIFVKSDYKLVQVELKKILYIEGLKDYIKIYTEDAPKPILSLMSMKSMEELLPPARFMRVHRSFIVQKDKIRIIDRGRIVFDKTYIPVSDSYKQTFQTFLDERS